MALRPSLIIPSTHYPYSSISSVSHSLFRVTPPTSSLNQRHISHLIVSSPSHSLTLSPLSPSSHPILLLSPHSHHSRSPPQLSRSPRLCYRTSPIYFNIVITSLTSCSPQSPPSPLSTLGYISYSISVIIDEISTNIQTLNSSQSLSQTPVASSHLFSSLKATTSHRSPQSQASPHHSISTTLQPAPRHSITSDQSSISLSRLPANIMANHWHNTSQTFLSEVVYTTSPWKLTCSSMHWLRFHDESAHCVLIVLGMVGFPELAAYGDLLGPSVIMSFVVEMNAHRFNHFILGERVQSCNNSDAFWSLRNEARK
ncbi:hypothetical protein Tco_0599396 [Tanacetum coccineum]